MNLVERARHTALGALGGALVACLILGLGLGPILGDPGMMSALTYGLLVGAPFGAIRREHWVFAASALLLVVFFFVGNTPAMAGIADRWIRDDGQPARQDAIVILSAYVQSDSALTAIGTERLLSGIELYRAGVAPRIVTSKIEIDDAIGHRTSTIDQQRLLSLAGITTGWTEVDSVNSTRDEAVRAAMRLLPAGVRNIVVVTSPFHTRRACATFEAVGFTVSCYPSRARRIPTRHPLNSETRVAAFGEYVYERLGMIKYRWKGWLPPANRRIARAGRPLGCRARGDPLPALPGDDGESRDDHVHLYFHRRDAVLVITRGSRVPT